MKQCKCEHWQICPTCKPTWFDADGNMLPPEPTPLQATHQRIRYLESALRRIRDETAGQDLLVFEIARDALEQT